MHQDVGEPVVDGLIELIECARCAVRERALCEAGPDSCAYAIPSMTRALRTKSSSTESNCAVRGTS